MLPTHHLPASLPLTLRTTVVCFALFALVYFPLAADAQVIPIADARALALGTEVTVEGFVTVPSGASASSTFDQGFALEDATAGIYVSLQENLGLHFNRRVRVTGVLDDDGFGQLVLRPASAAAVQTLPGALRVEAEELATGAVGEASEGQLVAVQGTVTRLADDTPFGYSVFIDDGSGETQIFIPISAGVNPFFLGYIAVGADIRASGLSGQFLSQYEVLPRFHGDLGPLP